MKKRYDSILEQRMMLVTAKESLMLTIQKWKQQLTSILRYFNAVRDNVPKSI